MRSWPLLAASLITAACGTSTQPPAEAEVAVPPFVVRGRWDDARALTYLVEEDGDRGLRAAVEAALEAWSKPPWVGFTPATGEPDLSFRWGGVASDADPDAPFGRDTGVARTGPVGPGCEVLFNPDHAWQAGGLAMAAVHEVGHALGLDHVELEGSAMHPQRERAQARPGSADLAGLHSLYGGGKDGPGDVRHEGFVLRGVAPPTHADWTHFDTDGDGRDEVLVWATGEVGHGALTIYSSDPQLRLARTLGPYLGVAGYGASVTPGVADDGQRFLELAWPDGSSTRRPFKPGGALGP